MTRQLEGEATKEDPAGGGRERRVKLGRPGAPLGGAHGGTGPLPGESGPETGWAPSDSREESSAPGKKGGRSKAALG